MKNRAEFLRVLAETGSPVQARRAVGVGSRAVRKWCEDEAFLEAYNEAIEVAQDAIRAKVREMALAGSESMLALSMKVIEPVLRRQSAVNVGVRVNGAGAGDDFAARRRARVAKMSDAELLAEMRRLQGDIEMRLASEQLPAADIVDVQAIEPVELPAPAGAAPAAPGEAAGPSAEDLI